jgi:hypothetical protein
VITLSRNFIGKANPGDNPLHINNFLYTFLNGDMTTIEQAYSVKITDFSKDKKVLD